MNIPLNQIQPFVYTAPDGLQLEVLFVLDAEKKGYINATAIAKQFGRVPKDWLKYENVQAYIQSLLVRMNLPKWENNPISSKTIGYQDLVVVQGGAPENGGGTWLHPRLAVIFARWLSPDFAVWCDEQIAELLHHHPANRQQFPELSDIFSKLAAWQQQLNHRFQSLEQRFDTTEQVFNRVYTQSVQDNQRVLGQIHHCIKQLDKAMHTQAQVEFLQPPVSVVMRDLLLEYQRALEKFLRDQQDELIQGYLIKIQENLAQIERHLPVQPAVLPPATASLATEINALRDTGQSWNAIAQTLNARGTPTVSGTGKWYGSSVKKYVAGAIQPTFIS